MTTARMPYEKASSSTASSRQPQLPTLARGIGNKPPLTPKIAAARTTQQQPNVAYVTPVPRRAPRPESLLSSNGANTKEELTSPVSAFLNTNNITPRSGSRQSRVDSANSTPNGTPKLERSESWEVRSGPSISGSGADDTTHKKPAVAFSPPLEVGGMLRQDNADSKFFYASDAQRPASMISPKPPPVQQQQRPATFFYANGGPPVLAQQQQQPQQQPQQQQQHSQSRDQTPPTLAAPMLVTPNPQDALMSKFVYANEIPDLQPPSKTTTRPSSVVSSSSRIPATRPASGIPMSPSYNNQRSNSPVKLATYQQINSGSNSALTSPRSPMHSAASVGVQSGQPQVNRPLAQQTNRPSHGRSGSLTIAEPPAVARILSAHGSVASSECASPIEPLAPPLNPQPTNPAATGFASLLQAAEDFADDEDSKPESLNSPTKASSQDGQLNELVANARRERKVQDLQITNASLEAINRTLERQLRKQTAEIRRYKRLSRSGRLSLVSAGSRVPSDSTVDGGGLARAGLGLDDLSEEESDMEEQETEFDDDEDMSASDDSGELSPEAIAQRDARHRKRDEKRLQLDLSKHQQLLIDSQKINQSLKRCLGWTEELIKEGKRALEYQVRVSEVELGGRVLAPEEVEGVEDDDADDDADLVGDGDETIRGIGLLKAELPSDVTLKPWSKDAQDRDSGIALPTDGG